MASSGSCFGSVRAHVDVVCVCVFSSPALSGVTELSERRKPRETKSAWVRVCVGGCVRAALCVVIAASPVDSAPLSGQDRRTGPSAGERLASRDCAPKRTNEEDGRPRRPATAKRILCLCSVRPCVAG